MKRVCYIIYRYLTHTDYNNMYRPPEMVEGGGGQLYIDFPMGSVPIEAWEILLQQPPASIQHQLSGENARHRWDNVPIHSVGLPSGAAQHVNIYQRRAPTICIAEQYIDHVATRIQAWHPDQDFPEPADRENITVPPEGLAVYLVRTYNDEIWAGWFINQRQPPYCNDAGRILLREMVESTRGAGDAGNLAFEDGQLFLNENNIFSPFTGETSSTEEWEEETQGGEPVPHRSASAGRHRPYRPRTNKEIVESLFDEDEDTSTEEQDQIREVTVRIRQRNQKAVRGLKELYQHECQITGSRLTFLKRYGTPYTEVHHLVPLGSGGSDNPHNMIVTSCYIHRMLHYAEVSGIDLSQIQDNLDGSAYLNIKINGEDYAIHWRAEHASYVMRYQEENQE